jgi:hypothetical protein
MSRTLDSRTLVPSIHIDEATVLALEVAAKQATLPGSLDTGVLIGHCDCSDRFPRIVFSRFNACMSADSESEIAPSSEDEVIGFVLFQKQANIDWDRVLKNYKEANQLIDGYTATFYYQPVFTAFYESRLSVHCYLLTPDMSLSITKIKDGVRNPDGKKRLGYATYKNAKEQSKHIDATFLGLTGMEDSRILALAYSLSLAYENKPIHALIGTSLYNVEVNLAEDMVCVEGDGTIDQKGVTFVLRVSGDPEAPPEPEPEPEPEKSSGNIIQKLTKLQRKINQLQETCDQQKRSRQKIESGEIETQQALRKILEAMSSKQQSENQKIPKFATPRSFTTPRRNPIALSVHMSQFWQGIDSELEETPARGPPVLTVKESAPPPPARPVKRGLEMATPKAVEQVLQKKLTLQSPAIQPSTVKLPEDPPKPARVPNLNEPSFFIDDYSKIEDMRAFFDVIGFRPARE